MPSTQDDKEASFPEATSRNHSLETCMSQELPNARDELPLTRIFSSIPQPVFIPSLPLWDHKSVHDGGGVSP